MDTQQAPETHRSLKADAQAAKARSKAMRPWFKKKRFIIPLVLIALMIISGIASSGSSDNPTSGVTADVSESAETNTAEPAAQQAAAPPSRACEIVTGETVDTFSQDKLIQLQGVLGEDISMSTNSLIMANLTWTTEKAMNTSFDRGDAEGQLSDLRNSIC